MGARVMHLADHLELSGAIYPFAAMREGDVIGQVRAALDVGFHPANNLQLTELAIAKRWLAQWIEPLPVPDVRDASTGEPILLVTEHYRVNDLAALASALAAQSDVSVVLSVFGRCERSCISSRPRHLRTVALVTL
jgi:hypothetical protein